MAAEVTLFSAAGAGDFTTVREMLTGDPQRVHSVDNNGYSALHWAALYDRYEVARYLLDLGADVTGKGQISLVADDNGVKSTATSSISNPGGLHPIHWSSQAGNVKLTMLLVEHGADIDARDAQGYQPIHFAAQASKSLMLHYLVLKGANVNARDYSDRTPLHWAAYHNRTENITYLLSRSAEINAVDSQLCSPLHWAAMRGCDSAAQLLIENRCNSRLVDAQGCTARTLAVQCKQTGVAQTLLELENFGYNYVYPLLKGRPFLYVFVCLLPFLLEIVPTYLWFTNESYWIRALILAVAFGLFSMTAHWHMPRNVNSPFPFVHVLLTGAIMYSTWYYRMTDVPWVILHVLLNVSNLGFWVFAMAASFTNAGHFRGPPVTLENLQELFAQGMREEMFCPTCLHWRPNRSKHCRVCDKCTARFDHHCPWVNNCIGIRNNKFFILFLMSALVGHASYVPLSYFVLMTEDVPSMLWQPFQCAWYLYEHKPWVTLALWTSNLHAAWEVMLLGEQLMCAMLNVTINERLNKSKYFWLLDAEGRFYNHYNRGFAANLYEVFIAPPVDYTKPHIIPTVDWGRGDSGVHDA